MLILIFALILIYLAPSRSSIAALNTRDLRIVAGLQHSSHMIDLNQSVARLHG